MAVERQRSAPDVETLHLGCGEDYRDDEWNVDLVEDCEPDQVIDLDDTPWPLPSASFAYVRAYHVFEHLDDPVAALAECARVLKPGGTLEVRVPIGLDARADPDHETEWTWRAPEFYSGDRAHWHGDLPLTVADRDVNLWPHLPGVAGKAYRLLLRYWLRVYGPGPWCFALPSVSGEFTILFEREVDQ